MAIVHHTVTGHLTLFVMDQIADVDHQLDEVNLTGTVTWAPVLPRGLSQAKATGPARLVSLKPIKSLVSAGQIVSLSGTVSEIGDVPGEVGQELPVMIDDTPIWWQCSFDVRYESTPVIIPTMLVDATEGDVDITTLVSAGGFPEVPTGDIESVIATVRSMSRAAEDAIRRVEVAAEAVGEVDAAAREAVRVAGESASVAESSAADSEASAVRSEAGADRVGSAEVVLDARDQATAAATTATGSATTATGSASTATEQADRATGQATAAAGSADAAHADAVATAADRVKTTSDATATAADRVATAADRTATGEHRVAAAQSATTAEGAASTATEQADRAKSEADRSKTEADRAEAAADLADGSAVQAVTDRVDALLAGAPEAYDTLSEIAVKLADQDDVASAMTAQIGQKVDRTSTGSRVYATDPSGNQTALAWQSGTAAADSVAVRGSGGRLLVGDPTVSGHAATKAYVDVVKTTADAALPASKIQVVDELPSSPAQDVLYLIPEA